MRYFLLFFLAGCMVGPNYKKPDIAMPSSFEGSVREASELCQFWKELNDPFLDTLLEEAMQGNFDFRLALEKIEQARADFKVARSLLYPEIDLNASAIRSRTSQNITDAILFGPPIQNLFQVGFDAIWELDFFGKFRREKNAEYHLFEASREDARNVYILMLSEVGKNYVDIRALQRQIGITKEKIDILTEELFLIRTLFEAGLKSAIDVELILESLEAEKATLPSLETSFKQSIYSLSFLLGKQPEGFSKEFDKETPIPIASGKVPLGLPSDLLRRRPDIRAAERQLAAATEKIGVAVADFFPHISLTGTGYGYESVFQNTWLIPSARFWSIGPSINWNLIDFGRTRGIVSAKTSLQKQALLQYEKTVIRALQDVEGALIAYFEEGKRKEFLQESLGAVSKTLVLENDLFLAGLVSDLDVLVVKKMQLDAESILVSSKQAEVNNFISLYKALGGNWECSSTP